MKNIVLILGRLAIIAALIVAPLVPARAQYTDQETWGGTSGGSANAQTLSIANWTANKAGVPIRFLPGAANTSSMTVNINGVGAVAIKLKTAAGLQALIGGELNTTQISTITFDGSVFELDPPPALNIGANALANSALAFNVPINLQLNASLGSNELTVSVCTTNSGSNTCNNASPTNPVPFSFPDNTTANGDPTIVLLQAAASITTGATTDSLGCTTAVACHIWVWAINNGGTVVPCLYVPLSGTSIVDLDETANQTSASGTGTGSSAQTLYCSASAVSGKAVGRLGYIEATWTSGTGWTAIGKVRLFGPGVKKPGDIVQSAFATSTAEPTGTGSTFTAEGATISLTPTSAADLVEIVLVSGMSSPITSGQWTQVSLYRGTTATAIGPPITQGNSCSSIGCLFTIDFIDIPATASSITYGGMVKASGAYGWGFPFSYLGSGISETLSVKEIMSALEPINDNDEPLRMVG